MIVDVSPEFHARALWLLLKQMPQETRTGEAARLKDFVEKRGQEVVFLVAREEDRILGAVMAVVMPGGTAGLFPAQITHVGLEEIADALTVEALARLHDRNIDLVQALLLPAHTDDFELLVRHNFQFAGDLQFLSVSCSADTAVSATGQETIQFTPFDDTQDALLEGIIEQTYVQSLDLPLLDGARPLHEVVAGYKQTGLSKAQNWFLVERNKEVVGCLLLAEHETHFWELVYLGLIPSVRGNGYGLIATEFARQHARDHGGQQLLLGVDSANWPAMNIYEAAGFQPMDKKKVMLRFLRKERES